MRADDIWSAASGQAHWRLRAIIALCIIGLIIFALRDSAAAAHWLSWPLSFIILAMATLRLCACYFALTRTRPDLFNPALLADPAVWPSYTVLVPMRDEAHMVEPLMSSLRALDYPIGRLEILMISEANDPATTAQVLKYLEPPFKSVVVPTSLPATKPKALNVAMEQAKGEIVTIYDAEDRPHSGQLKCAARALIRDDTLEAVQAPLWLYNAPRNFLTKQFTLEYASLFQVWNPALARLGLPFPLGGTSNHIKREALDMAGWWDPHNVTEDADLSFRLSAMGWSIGAISLATKAGNTGEGTREGTGEEAVSHYPNWLSQRVRWQKGFLQSWQVHMRQIRGLGWRRVLALQITLGTTIVVAFLHPFAIFAMTLIFFLKTFALIGLIFAPHFIAVMLFGYGSAIYSAYVALRLSGQRSLYPSLFLMPLYWMMMFIPACLSVVEIIRAPYHWNKTRHEGEGEGGG
ncbi:MAG: glycosyltransferase [Robiginitomaculum sp.]